MIEFFLLTFFLSSWGAPTRYLFRKKLSFFEGYEIYIPGVNSFDCNFEENWTFGFFHPKVFLKILIFPPTNFPINLDYFKDYSSNLSLTGH